ncbi:speckle targeted PIP5K1A-regulated poly(A) polymerase-like [Uloborus diversus]|uniref:speckle targeted PIP5K1A-regulated poly(A) polymerase-like n=1 Tax=Uloborus diversus TaxID=327109 RepID=UPI002409449A|nr:speckle targeted PIP5K1A-regulated poly(A) polymerase-like [Uloborus diversus]
MPMVSSQIETFCSLLSITQEDIENRKKFCQSLSDTFQLYFPQFKLNQFGSSVNGLGFKGCDVDVSIQTIFNDEPHVMLKEVPSLDSVINGEVSDETVARMTPQYLLRFVRRILRRHCPDIREPILLIKARCPILRFYHSKYDVFCDFSCENEFSLRNTKVLRLLCHYDERFAPLAKLVRYWGKYGGFVGDIDMFNSYAFSLLVVHFLQTRDPPILPPLTTIDDSEYLHRGNVNDDDLLFREVKKIPPSKTSTNDLLVECLLKEFFFYYLNFDFSRVILPLKSTSIPKSDFLNSHHVNDEFEFGSVCVLDPFRPSFNTTSSANYKNCKRFLSSLINTCSAYQDQSLWIPQAKMWGLCSLFHLPKAENKVYDDWRKNLVHKIELPYKLQAKDILLKILEHGLLFNCSSFNTENEEVLVNNVISKPIMKLHCKSYYNTWQGRDLWLQKYKHEAVDFLELHHLISVELSKSKMETRRQMLFDFQILCSEVSDNTELKLLLTLTFKESKFPPIVAIFLKEFIPELYNKL